MCSLYCFIAEFGGLARGTAKMQKIIYSLAFIFIVLFFIPFIIFWINWNFNFSDYIYLWLKVIASVVLPLITSIACGIYSGVNIKIMWFMPIVVGAAFFMSGWYVFGVSDIDFMMYSGTYVIIGYIAMLAAYLVKRIVKRTKE